LLIESGLRIKVKADLCGAKSPLVAIGSMQMHRQSQVSDFAKIYQQITTTAQNVAAIFFPVGRSTRIKEKRPR
jgi:hypothetical protein